jgi:uncharacterized membrane protein YhhN
MRPEYPAVSFLANSRRLTHLAAAACLALLLSLNFGFVTGVVVAKVIASSSFVGVALTCGALQSTYGRILLGGLCLCWFGDMFLISQSERIFLFGLVAFLLGHLCYMGAFISHGLDRRWLLLTAMPLAGAAILVISWLAPDVPRPLFYPVVAYTLVISAMVLCALGARGAGAPLLVPLGALLFYFSDLSVAMLRFVDNDARSFLWGLPFYYGAQLLLAHSVAAVSGSTTDGEPSRENTA